MPESIDPRPPASPSDRPADPTSRPRGPSAARACWRAAAVVALGGVLATGTALCLAGPWDAPDRRPGPQPEDDVEKPPPAHPRGAGEELRRYPAGTVGLPADTPVIGVSAGGEHRAYVVRTLEAISNHVADDVLGGRPVVVTYCDRTECARAFEVPPGSAGPSVRVAGYAREGGLLLEAGGRVYYQETGAAYAQGGEAFPHPAVPATRTTWGEWVKAHPDTSVACYPTLWRGAWMSTYPDWMTAVPDGAAVAGVTVDGRHRAYLLEAFGGLDGCVVRDFLNGQPLTVTYSPGGRPARVFAAHGGGADDAPMTLAGWHQRPAEGGMLLDVGGQLYDQASRQSVGGPPAHGLPCPELPAVQTTWGEWRAAHPGTSVYLGDLTHYTRAPERGPTPAAARVGRYRFALVAAGAVGLAAVLAAGRRPRREPARGVTA